MPSRFTCKSLFGIFFFGLALALVRPAGAAEAGFPAFAMPETALTLRAEGTPRRFIAAHGRRGLIVGYAAGSLEGWVYPFRILHDYRVGFRPEGSNEAIPGAAAVREVIVNPETVTRVYSGEDFTVRETLFVPLDEGGFEILFQVDSHFPLHIAVSFRPDLDLMWPAGIGGQSYDWDADRHAFTLLESSEKYSALVGSPAAGLHSAQNSYAEPGQVDRTLSLELDIPANSADRIFPLLASLSAPPYYNAEKTYEALLARTPALYAEAREHYGKLLESGMQVETTDERLNLAYLWARIALDQAYVCNPWLGCGLVAGYGPSHHTRRPQYAWFFGGDALNNTFALEASGDHALARDALRFIQKYQKKDSGEIFHELSQSAGLIDWFKDYPYGYRHTDVSAMYLVAFRNLYRASGDADFVRSSWDSIKAAYRYLVSRVDPSDGLVTIPAGGWGGDETINQQVAKDVYLESVWVAGAEAFEGLANYMGDHNLAADAHAHAEKARTSFADKFWNPKRDFFYYGFNGKGELLSQELGQPNWGIWQGAVDEEKSRRALANMAHARWETDWGLRSVPADDPLYIGNSYGHGSVWPLGTGVQALAFYRYHRPFNAEPLVHALVEQSFVNSLGHVPEVLSGDFYRELDVSVPEQIWSSGMVITSLLGGMLGLDPDAPNARLRFAPHLPPNWRGVVIHNLRVGQSSLDLRVEQSYDHITLRADPDGPPVEIEFSPQIPLGSRNLRADLNGGQSLPLTIRSYAQDLHAEVKFTLSEKSELVLKFEGGMQPWLPPEPLQIGDQSHGLRVLSSTLDSTVSGAEVLRRYKAEVEGRPKACSAFETGIPGRLAGVLGGKYVGTNLDGFGLFAVSPQPDSCVGSNAGSWNFITTRLLQQQIAMPEPAVHPQQADYGPYKTWTFQIDSIEGRPKPEEQPRPSEHGAP
ncbi:MAG: GH116 family glycosyl hydrolase [Terriglobia bacterium]